MKPLIRILILVTSLDSVIDDVLAQEIRSPEVHADRTVTLRLRVSRAKEVMAEIDGRRLPLQKGEDEVWSVTTPPLSSGIHDYDFRVDGTRMIDPSNRNVKKWFSLKSMVEIPGDPPLLTEFLDVPHGEVRRLVYSSKAVGQQRPVMVYVPPGYDRQPRDERLPLIVLMHGFGDDETAWTEVGRCHLIADNLIAQKKIRPCVIAMPYGHPIPPPFGKRSERPKDYFSNNNLKYEADIVGDLLPFLNDRFRLHPDREQRSIVGLSMGGGHAVHTGLRHLDTFGSIGAFSAAMPEGTKEHLETLYPDALASGQTNLKHFWIPIGRDDFLLERNEAFVRVLTEKQIDHTFTITDGGHGWDVWREYLPRFLEKTVGTRR